ncbi:MAG TPA: FkbM family methyltransferase [Pyrinomonadaceae bacterium]|jgi:FkbM family methyltransferase|nr:FkbM family methyltransferase [Pyrinomonadaceae bacterium]
MPLKAIVKSKVAKTLCHPRMGKLLALLFRDRIPSRGCVVATDSPVITPEIKAMLFWRFYESAEIRFVDRYIRRDLDVVELGSSLGVVACQIRKRISESSKLLCVEANPGLVGLISRNLEVNSLDKKVSIIGKAIDYDPTQRGSVNFHFGDSNISGKVAEQQRAVDGSRVPTTTLAQLMNENGINDYVLVSDIEGAEAGIALADKEALKTCRQIIIELHDTVFDNKRVDVEQMCKAFINLHGFTLRDRYGPVCVFEK